MWHGADNLGRGEILLRFTCRVDFGNNDLVGILKGAGKIQEKSLGTRICMRLPNGPDAPLGITRPRACQRRRDLGRMVSIVIEDTDAIDVTTLLKAASCSCKLRMCLRSFLAGETQHVYDRKDCQGVTNIVRAGHLQGNFH